MEFGPHFSSNADATQGLRKLAELLFEQAQLFGQLSVDQRVSGAQIESAIIRTGPVLSFLEVLEQVVDLQFDSAYPFCYNRDAWPTNVCAGGYTSDPIELRPSEVLRSLVLAWNLPDVGLQTISTSKGLADFSSEGIRSGVVHRFIRGALAVASIAGLEASIDYVFDLLRCGYAMDSRSITDALCLLLVGRSQSEDEMSMVAKFYGGRAPKTALETIENDITYEWIEVAGLGWRWESPSKVTDAADFVINSEKVRPHLQAILSRALRDVESVRASKSFDEWLVGQVTLAGQLTVVDSVITSVSEDLSLPTRALLSQFEEIRADAGSLAESIANGHGVPSFFDEEIRAFREHVADSFRRLSGPNWEARFFKERLLVPEALRASLLPNASPTPVLASEFPEWDAISWVAAQPLCHSLRQQEPVIVVSAGNAKSLRLRKMASPVVPAKYCRSRTLDNGVLIISDEVLTAFADWGITDPDEAVALMRDISSTLSHSYLEPSTSDVVIDMLARTLLRRDSNFGDRRVSWSIDDQRPDLISSLDGKAVRLGHDRSVLIGQYTAALAAEISGVLRSAFDCNARGDHRGAVDILEQLRVRFPWCAPVYQELGINLDQSGLSERALEAMTRAVVLEPRQSLLWQSLGVILARLDAGREGAIAQAIAQAAAQVEHKYALD